MSKPFENKTILITGGAQRIGRRLTERYLELGARILLHYRLSDDAAKELQKTAPDRVFLYQADFCQSTDVKRMAGEIRAAGHLIDGIIQSASSFYPTPWPTVTETQWDDLMGSNARGPFFLIQEVQSLLTEESWITTLVDIYASKPLRGYLPYTAAKAALLQMTRGLAEELKPRTRVNSVSPGHILSPESWSTEKDERAASSRLLPGRAGPEDIVEASLFLAKNQYITGFDLKVDGGTSL